MDKSPDAYRTISEVADELGLPQHVLRFWETRFPQIKPLKRGGGRRYYKPDDIDLVRGIQTLLYSEGYTIKGVQRILKEDGVKPVQMVGRGNAFAGERPAADEPDDDVFTETEIDVSAEPAAPLTATRERPVSGTSSDRKEPVLSSGSAREPRADIFVSKLSSQAHKSASATLPDVSRTDALRFAISELEECARLIEIAREKA